MHDMVILLSDKELFRHLPKIKRNIKKEGLFADRLVVTYQAADQVIGSDRITGFALAACYLGYVASQEKRVAQINIPVSMITELEKFFCTNLTGIYDHPKVMEETKRLWGAESNGLQHSHTTDRPCIFFDQKGEDPVRFERRLKSTLGSPF